MTALICTCIRDTDPRTVAVPDPTCTHPTELADRDAHSTATALGRLITITAALALIAIGVVTTAPGQIGWPTAAWITGVGLIARLVYVASKEHQT